MKGFIKVAIIGLMIVGFGSVANASDKGDYSSFTITRYGATRSAGDYLLGQVVKTYGLSMTVDLLIRPHFHVVGGVSTRQEGWNRTVDGVKKHISNIDSWNFGIKFTF